MDLSKLPKLSQTPKPPEENPPQQSEPPGQRTGDPRVARMMAGPEAWIGLAIGLILLLMQQRFLGFVFRRDIGTFLDEKGQTIAYTQTIFFLNDVGLAVFGVALMLDGVLLLAAKPWSVALGLVVTVIACVLNLYTVVRLYSGYGLQVLPALAVAFGVYTAMFQWKVMLSLRGRTAPMT
jgi:hypothetical protein